jgi:hypothetical protein
MTPFPSLPRNLRNVRTLLVAAAVGCALLGATGCDDGDEDLDDTTPRQSRSAGELGRTTDSADPLTTDNSAANGDAADMVSMDEPTENAYTVQVPQGWKPTLGLVQVYDQKKPTVTLTAPGGEAFLFLGDPQMPAYALPSPQFNENSLLANANPMLKISPYKPAKEYFSEYLKKKFGKLPEFRIVGIAPNPKVEKMVRESAQRQGMDAQVDSVVIAFDYQDNGKRIRSLVNGSTIQFGQIWVADINGVSTGGDPTRYGDLLLRVASSFRMNPQWQERQRAASQARHEETMAMIQRNTERMTRRHEANMAWIRESSARHQARMDSLHAAADARNAAWKARDAASDHSHQQFLNYIKGEETVVNSSGVESQVQSGQGRYFRHKTENTYIGTDATQELEDLRKNWGLNPDDYENVQIKR